MAGRLGLYLSNVGIILVERTLEDYFDLNRRYLKISDTLLFADEQVKFDVIPKYYFSLLPDEFYNLAFVKSDKLVELQSLEEISPFLKLDDEKLLKVINKDNKTAFSQIGDIKQFVADERTKRFNKLIDEKLLGENESLKDHQVVFYSAMFNFNLKPFVMAIAKAGNRGWIWPATVGLERVGLWSEAKM